MNNITHWLENPAKALENGKTLKITKATGTIKDTRGNGSHSVTKNKIATKSIPSDIHIPIGELVSTAASAPKTDTGDDNRIKKEPAKIGHLYTFNIDKNFLISYLLFYLQNTKEEIIILLSHVKWSVWNKELDLTKSFFYLHFIEHKNDDEY
jgi:hypothetical protein